MKNFCYRVQQGDTLYLIADRFNIPVTLLIKENNLSREIEEGDILYLIPCETDLYVVKPTDTLLTIADSFNKPPEKILEDNAVPYIYVGLKLKL